MPVEVTLLKDKPKPIKYCPICRTKDPLDTLLRGTIQRPKRTTLTRQKQHYVAIICRQCNNIIGHESPIGFLPQKTKDPIQKRLQNITTSKTPKLTPLDYFGKTVIFIRTNIWKNVIFQKKIPN